MSKNPCTYSDKIHKLLKALKKQNPTQNIARHIAMATADYTDLWSMTDKELLYALERYSAELDMNTVPDESIEAILRDDIYSYNEDDEDCI